VAAVRFVVRQQRRVRLRGKNALVTGGSRGLGLQIARRLVERGVNVAVVARDMHELERAVDLLREHAAQDPETAGVRVIGVPCDLEYASAIDSMIRSVRAKLGPIDLLVNNAGSIQVGPLDSMTLEDFQRSMKLHCFAALRTSLAVRGDMHARGGGRIANIASIGGVISVPHLLPYSAGKFALVGLSQGLHTELAGEGIVVSTIAPGLMRTGSPRNATFKGDHRSEYAWFSIADSLPGLSMSSRRAARRIVSALEFGDAYVVLGLPAKLGAVVNAIAPNLTSRLLGFVHSLLPSGTDATPHLGSDSTSNLAPSSLTALTERAELDNNQRS
jgi:short-subunit dehydrogenase